MIKKNKNSLKNKFKKINKIRKLLKVRTVSKKSIKMFIPFYKTLFFSKFKSFLTFKSKSDRGWRSAGYVFNRIWDQYKINPFITVIKFKEDFGLGYKMLSFYKSGRPLPLPTPLRYSSNIFFFLKQFITFNKQKKGQKAIHDIVFSVFSDLNFIYFLNNQTTQAALSSRKYRRYRW